MRIFTVRKMVVFGVIVGVLSASVLMADYFPELEIGGNNLIDGARIKALGYSGDDDDANIEIGDGYNVFWRLRRHINNTFRTVMSSSWSITGGNVGIGTTIPNTKLHVAGTVSATNYTCNSDVRYKKDITPIQSALNKVLALQGVTCRWRAGDFSDKGFSEKTQIGFIAQDVEKVIPELVSTGKDGYKSLSYNKLTAVLVEAIKELKAENDSLKNRIASLQTISRRVAVLERALDGKQNAIALK